MSLRNETFACSACDEMRVIAVLELPTGGHVFGGMYCRACRELRSPDGLLEFQAEFQADRRVDVAAEEALFT